MTKLNNRGVVLFCTGIFLISGFSGLIYESVWSRYLKLLLGHAAYAQALVLIIFMGGMAIGAWLLSRYTEKLPDLLLVYAVIEGVIGIFALLFHSIFTTVTAITFGSIIPAIDTPWLIYFVKWFVSALIILPQSILLGATFPAMVGGLLRISSGKQGYWVAMLYFVNSFGAAIGVLASSFYFIKHSGLPGTSTVAGMLNLFICVAVIMARKRIIIFKTEATASSIKTTTATNTPVFHSKMVKQFLLVSAVTGMASFMYEIGWIRMLAMVLSSSTHAFELMLSAFILGLAFGGLWVRRHIDQHKNPKILLGWVQIVMGTVAILSIFGYNASFYAMTYLLQGLQPNNLGYFIFNWASYGIALAIMLPTTFCAGMTLPLITHTLMQEGNGEKSIGMVYAANTLGAIVGVLTAMHIAIPLLGLKSAIGIGALLDITLGIWLLWKRQPNTRLIPAIMVSVGTLLFVWVAIPFNPLHQASGVYRTQKLSDPEKTTVLSHEDGRTASVSVIEIDKSYISIATNGKPDASFNKDRTTPSTDEITQLMLGYLPRLIMPEAERVAVIGFGSGISTHTLLASENLKVVDTIEIEPAMYRGAIKYFKPVNYRVLEDPRSRIHFDDAKTFFSNKKAKYDMIVSEPSNPWVSGVSSLFTTEFYQTMKSHLNEQGMLVQWIHGYEFNMLLFSSIIKAINENFLHYQIWKVSPADYLVFASNKPIPNVDQTRFQATLDELQHHHIYDLHGLERKRIGNKSVLDRLFNSIAVPANSDFYPLVDLEAPKVRFIGNDFNVFTSKMQILLEAIGRSHNILPYTNSALPPQSESLIAKVLAYLEQGVWTPGEGKNEVTMSNALYHDLAVIRSSLVTCKMQDTPIPDVFSTAVSDIAQLINETLSLEQRIRFWQPLLSNPCIKKLPPIYQQFVEIHASIGQAEYKIAYLLAKSMEKDMKQLEPRGAREVGLFYMLGAITQKEPEQAIAYYQKHKDMLSKAGYTTILLTQYAANMQKSKTNP